MYDLKGRTPHEIVTGDTPDISEWMEYDWYQPVWYLDPGSFPGDKKKLGRWLGVAHRVGQAMCYWVLPPSGVTIARSTVQPVSADELATQDFTAELAKYDQDIAEKFADGNILGIEPPLTLFDLDDYEQELLEPFDPAACMPEADDYDAEAYDSYISAHVLLPKGDSYERATVLGRKRNQDGNPIGKANANPLLDTRVYDVEFDDGATQEYLANAIAESLYSQVDPEGNEFLLMDKIIDHIKDSSALHPDNMYVEKQGSNRHYRRTTKGWKLLIQWKDGTSSWEPLKDLKESNPVQVAEYAVANKLAGEPAFVWWVKDVLRRRERIISKVKSRYHKRTHKFGIQVPKTVKEALQLDSDTGTDLWRKAIEKEMKAVQPAFKFLDNDEKVPIGYQFITCHMIFDVKMDFTRKARFVAGGHMTEPPASLTYSSVVSQESVRIALTVAALNDLDVLAADVGNAYLNADCREKIWCIAGPEFGSNQGKKVIIVRALYGLKSSGAAWRAHLASTMSDLHFEPCQAEPDLWMRPASKPDGFTYWEYVLIYVDDLLVVSHQANEIMENISALYRLKEDPKTGKCFGKPDHYLGSTVGTYTFHASGQQ